MAGQWVTTIKRVRFTGLPDSARFIGRPQV